MSSSFDDHKDIAKRERAVNSLAERSGVSLEEIRGLFTNELTRLERGATIRTYLHVLAMAGVRATLRRRGAAASTT